MRLFRLTILERYLLSEILKVLAAVLLVLLLIMLSTKLVRFLKFAASGEWPADIVLPMLGLYAVNGVTLIMPMAIFLAVIMAVGRLYRDSEMTVISGCGISTLQLYRPLGLLAIILGFLLGFISFWVIPETKKTSSVLELQAEKTSQLTALSAGRFQETRDGSRVVYVEDIDDETGIVDNIFVHTRKNGTVSLLTAASAHQHIEDTTGDKLIVMQHGFRYTGIPGETKFRSTEFNLHWVRAEINDDVSVRHDQEIKPTTELLNSDNPLDIAELHWRIAMVISPILFTLLGLPLGKLNQREGRYSRIMTGVLIYIIYFKLLRVGQVLIERESIPLWLGLWWIHAGLIVFLMSHLISQRSVKSAGWWAQYKLKRAT